MQEAIGEYIRQARRQRNLTQTELGGNHFSKSYVSAVERNKIVPSSEALKFFAEQLERPDDYFTLLFERAVTPFDETGLTGINSGGLQDDELSLLDSLLENKEFQFFPVHYDQLPTLSPEAIALLPPSRQARYYFLLGLMAQEHGNLSTALHAFEHALVLAPVRHYPAILDELGVNCHLARAYQAALSYHLRALHYLRYDASDKAAIPLLFKVELHCANDYRVLGAYREALEHYEHARGYLNSQHDIRSAGLLYWALGYCTYELVRRETTLTDPADTHISLKEIEGRYQRAISYLLQSRSVYQVSGDRKEEMRVRLTLAQVLLNFSSWRQYTIKAKAEQLQIEAAANVSSLLDEATEQCRQVLMNWHEPYSNTGAPSIEEDQAIYIALAYLIQVHVQQAAAARLRGYVDTAYRERARAAYLCQEMLDTFFERASPLALIGKVLSPGIDTAAYQPPSLPTLPDSSNGSDELPGRIAARVELYLAAGRVAEEIGRAAVDYADDCYARADRFFQASIEAARSVALLSESGPSDLARLYQQCVVMLEERTRVAPNSCEETTTMLIHLLKESLYHLQFPRLPVARDIEVV